jgi:hypothetical protein
MVRRRRFHYDTLATSTEPRWLKHYDRMSNEFYNCRLEPGTDLHAVMRQEAERFKGEGWTIESDEPDNWTGTFFMKRAGDRRRVAIVPIEKPLPPHSIPPCPGGWDWKPPKR